VAAVLTNRLKSQSFQCTDDLPSGEVRKFRHGLRR
jgi:hypothetical protein